MWLPYRDVITIIEAVFLTTLIGGVLGPDVYNGLVDVTAIMLVRGTRRV